MLIDCVVVYPSIYYRTASKLLLHAPPLPSIYYTLTGGAWADALVRRPFELRDSAPTINTKTDNSKKKNLNRSFINYILTENTWIIPK